MSARLLFLSIAAMLGALAAAELAFRNYVEARFIPERTFRSAVAAGSGCVLTLGDSRMVAGVSATAVRSALEKRGISSCLAELAVGAGGSAVQFAAFRRYLERAGRPPSLIVLGSTPDSLLAPDTPPDPSTYIGNEAVVLGWSHPEDVRLLYPGFPREHFDAGFRFSTSRSTALTAYGSLVWAKVRELQDRLVGIESSARNRFGLLSDMEELARTMNRNARERLRGFPERFPIHPSFRNLLRLAREHGVRVIVVEVPMPSSHRELLSGEDVKRVRAALRAEVGRLGSYELMGDNAWAEDRHFPDGLHLGAEGARRFSEELALVIARAFHERRRDE